MKALLYKDFLMLRKKGKMFLGFTVIFALFGVVEENVFFFSLLSCLYPSMAVITLLGLEEQAKWAGYGVLLPVSRKVQTAEKYLFSVLGLLAGILINLIFNLVGGTNTRDFLDVLPVILIVGLLFAAFELPLIYKVGIGKAKLGYLFVAGLAIAAVAIFTRITGENSEAWRIVFSGKVLWGGAAASFWLFLVSMVFSMNILVKKKPIKQEEKACVFFIFLIFISVNSSIPTVCFPINGRFCMRSRNGQKSIIRNAIPIAGDVFDRSIPSGEAINTVLDEFLTELSDITPRIPVLLIAGNHDSAEEAELCQRFP